MGICDAEPLWWESVYPEWGEYYIHRAVVEKVDDDHIQVMLEMQNLGEPGPLAAEGEVLIQISDKEPVDRTWSTVYVDNPITGRIERINTSDIPDPIVRNETFIVEKSDYITDEWGRDPMWVSPPFKGNVSEHFEVSFINENGNISEKTPLVQLTDDGWSVISNY